MIEKTDPIMCVCGNTFKPVWLKGLEKWSSRCVSCQRTALDKWVVDAGEEGDLDVGEPPELTKELFNNFIRSMCYAPIPKIEPMEGEPLGTVFHLKFPDLPKPENTCAWREDADGNWDTQCGECHVFITSGPEENKHRYCPYCGKLLLTSTD